MIKRLHFYLFKHMLYAFLFAGIAVTMVVLFTQSFRLLSFVIGNSGTALIFFQLMGLTVPTFLPLVAPLSLGIGILFIYHKFAVDSEIVVMRAAGISPWHLAQPALVLALFVVLLGYILSLWITPAANRELVALQYKVRDSYSIFLVKPGNFNDLAEGLTFYVRARGPHGELQDILIHDVRKPETPVTIMAATGQFTTKDGEPQIVVFEGERQEVDRTTGHLSQLNFDRYVLDLNLLRNSAAERAPDTRELDATELFDAMADEGKARNTRGHVNAELHQRLATPLLALSYALIGLTTILAGEFNRRGMTRRIFIAALAIIGVQAATISIISSINKDSMLIPLLYLITILPIPVCLALLIAPEWTRRLFFRPAENTPTLIGKAS